MQATPQRQRNLAVYIDFENFEREAFDIERFMQRLMERGRILLKRAYGDWGRHAAEKQPMLRAAVDLVELPSNVRGKNRADIRLVVDAMETAMTRSYIDTFVIASGDSDFLPLIAKLRELDRWVIVVARKGAASSLLAAACDELVYYEALAGQQSASVDEMRDAEDLLRRAIARLDNNNTPTLLANVKNYMRQLDPAFDESHLGFAQFKSFAQELARRGLLQLEPAAHGESRIVLAAAPARPVRPPQNDVQARAAPVPRNLAGDVLDRIHWAMRLASVNSTPGSAVNLASLGSCLRRLYADWGEHPGGWGRPGGLLRLARALDAEQWATLAYDAASNQHLLEPCPEFLGRQVGGAAPPDLEGLLRERAERFQQARAPARYHAYEQDAADGGHAGTDAPGHERAAG